MWINDDEYTSSELYRLSSPKADDPLIVISPDVDKSLGARAARVWKAARPSARWLGGVVTGIAIAVAAGLIVFWITAK